MHYKTTVELIRQRIDCRKYLQKSKGGLYVCPFCGSGTGAGSGEADGGLKYYEATNTWTCFACKTKGREKYSGDVIDLHMESTGEQFAEAVRELAEMAGITEPVEFDAGGKEYSVKAKTPAGNPSFNGTGTTSAPISEAQPLQVHTAAPAAPEADYSAYYEQCQKALAESAEAQAYLRSRGIDPATAISCGIGFDPQSDPASAPGAMGNARRPHPVPRIIIPTSKTHYVGRSIKPDTAKGYQKLNSKGSTPAIFQAEMLYYGADCVFVTEGAFDALSVIEAGRHAIALNSAANRKTLIKQLEQRPTESTLILCLDADSAGQAATQQLKDDLRRLNVSFITADICGGHKDPNEALTADRTAFEAAVMRAVTQTAARPDSTALYLDAQMAADIERMRAAKDKKTGFSNLDAKARALYSGLYVLAAISSLGKTTLALQMADQLAAAGHEVLFFSMEQSRLEMVSKSLARLTAQRDMRSAVNSLAIRQGNLPLAVTDAIKEYRQQTGERLSIIEGNFSADIGFISDYIRRYVRINGTRPTVFIDYLQILQPSAEGKTKGSKKDEVDLSITELKRLSRELDLTIIVISSLNRANYQTPFSFESLKESGSIEYTADVVWGLQLQCLEEELFDAEGKIKKKRKRIEEAKAETPRRVKLVCLKNRYGISHYEVNFAYYPEFDLFVPAPDTEPADRPLMAGGRRK